jgi:hypothetical protein
MAKPALPNLKGDLLRALSAAAAAAHLRSGA